MTYRYFELQKNVDPEREDSAQLRTPSLSIPSLNLP